MRRRCRGAESAGFSFAHGAALGAAKRAHAQPRRVKSSRCLINDDCETCDEGPRRSSVTTDDRSDAYRWRSLYVACRSTDYPAYSANVASWPRDFPGNGLGLGGRCDFRGWAHFLQSKGQEGSEMTNGMMYRRSDQTLIAWYNHSDRDTATSPDLPPRF